MIKTSLQSEFVARYNQFRIYELESKRRFRVVLKDIRPSICLEEIKQSTNAYGHEAKCQAQQNRHFTTVNLNDIYGNKTLLNTKVRFEPSHPVTLVRCQ